MMNDFCWQFPSCKSPPFYCTYLWSPPVSPIFSKHLLISREQVKQLSPSDTINIPVHTTFVDSVRLVSFRAMTYNSSTKLKQTSESCETGIGSIWALIGTCLYLHMIDVQKWIQEKKFLSAFFKNFLSAIWEKMFHSLIFTWTSSWD